MIEVRPPDAPAIDLRVTPLKEWRCVGRKRDGRPCNKILTEYAATGSIVLRKRCDECKTWNTIQQ